MASSIPLPSPGAIPSKSGTGLPARFLAWANGLLAACLAWEQALDAQLEMLRQQMAAMGDPPQFAQEIPPELRDTPWSHGNGGSQYGGGAGPGQPGEYTTNPNSYTQGDHVDAGVYEAFRRRADAAAESLRLWIAANERRRRLGLPPLPWMGTGGFG